MYILSITHDNALRVEMLSGESHKTLLMISQSTLPNSTKPLPKPMVTHCFMLFCD